MFTKMAALPGDVVTTTKIEAILASQHKDISDSQLTGYIALISFLTNI